MKKMGTKKVVLVGVVTIFLLGSGIGYKVYADSVRQEKIATELAVAKDQLKQASKDVKKSYDSTQTDFLKKDFSKADMEQVKKNVEKTVKEVNVESLKDSENVVISQQEQDLEHSFKKLSTKFETQTKLNAFFLDVTINGAEVENDLVIKDDLTEKELEGFRVESLPKNDKWSEAVSTIFVNAKTQVDQIKKVNGIVDAMYEGKAVKADVSKEQVEQATKEIAAIRNEKAKTTLSNRLKAVTDEIAKKEAETKAKAEEESKKVAEEQAKSTGGTVVKNADGTYSAQAPATPTNEAPQTNSNTNNQSSDNGNWNQGSTNNGGGANNGASNSGNNGGGASNNGNNGGNWSGTGNQTDGGDFANNTGEEGVNGGGTGSWTGGDFDGSGIDTSGWN